MDPFVHGFEIHSSAFASDRFADNPIPFFKKCCSQLEPLRKSSLLRRKACPWLFVLSWGQTPERCMTERRRTGRLDDFKRSCACALGTICIRPVVCLGPNLCLVFQYVLLGMLCAVTTVDLSSRSTQFINSSFTVKGRLSRFALAITATQQKKVQQSDPQ